MESTRVEDLGHYRGVVRRFEDHTGIPGFHTLSITKGKNEQGYFGYAGTFTDGPIDLWMSDTLVDWRPYSDNPIMSKPGLRWSSVVTHDDTFYMATRGTRSPALLFESEGRSAAESTPLFVADRLSRKVFGQKTSSISLFTSKDGVDFTGETKLVPEYHHGNRFNQNPFLFELPSRNAFGLIYYTGTDEWKIALRTSETVEGLVDAKDTILLSATETLAAPALFYWNGSYHLMTESIDSRTGEWVTDIRQSERLRDGFEIAEPTRMFENDRACASPFVADQSLYIFVSKRVSTGLIPKWHGELHRYDAD